MKFYSSINQYYDFIFPLNFQQVQFVQKEFPVNSSLIDIGCSTGSLAIELAAKEYKMAAFDLDADMIQRAIQKNAAKNVAFRTGNMLHTASEYPSSEFDGVLCFGNTLVHITNKRLIKDFFAAVHQVLKTNGKFLFQVLNYELILSEKRSTLPVIDNENIRFIRNYEFLENGLLHFKTKLTVKENSQVINNEVELLPITKTEIEVLLVKTGFKEIEFFGDFAGSPLLSNSMPLIICALK